MTGGRVKETITVGNFVWVNVYLDDDECGVYVEATPQARCISPGDKLVWSGLYAYWTPKGRDGCTLGDNVDVPIRKRGVAGQPRPNPQ